MASLYGDPDATVGENYKVLVHGGYAADIFAGNRDFFTTQVSSVNDLNGTGIGKDWLSNKEFAQGSLILSFGKKSTIKNLLLSKISVTESNVEVANQNGSNRKPLYYRVNAQFTGVKPLLSVDVDDMFKFAQ